MISVALALCLIQDADRSTPDKALESFVAFWDRGTQDVEFWRKLEVEAEELSRSWQSEKLRAKLAKKREEKWKLQDDFRIVPGKLNIKDRVLSGDECLFTCWRDMKIRSRNFTSGQVEEKDTQEPYSFTFRKHGGEWLLQKMMKCCPSCTGTGRCYKCGGTGRGQSGSCTNCGGKKLCPRCGGKCLVEESLTHAMFVSFATFYVADGEFEASKDRSTAEGVVKAYMDSWTVRELVTTKRILAWLDERLPEFCKFLAPINAEAAKKVLQMDIDIGKKRYRSIQREVRGLKERGDLAFAMAVVSIDGIEYKTGLLVEGGSVAGHLTQQCVMCAGRGACEQCQSSGKCSICKGTGQLEGGLECTLCGGKGECFGCKGKGGCESCKGFGMIEGE